MGDRYTIQIKCANCGEENEHWHAESSCNMDFVCSKCKKTNWVYMGFTSKIVDEKELKELYKDFGCE